MFFLISGEKIYKCEFCDFATAWRKNLRKHRLIHAVSRDTMGSHTIRPRTMYVRFALSR